MNLRHSIERCIDCWPAELEVLPIFQSSWGMGLYITPALAEAHDRIEESVINSVNEVPDREIHKAILMALKKASVTLAVLRPSELQPKEVARILRENLTDASFISELGYTDHDRRVRSEVLKAAEAMVAV